MMVRHFLVTIFGAFGIIALCHYYLYLRLVLPVKGPHDVFWISTFVFLCAYTFFGFIILRVLPHYLRKLCEFFMFLWMGIGFVALILSLITMPFELLFGILHLNQIYIWNFLILGTVLVSTFAVYNALKEPKIITTSIPLTKDIPEEIKQLKIVQISDVHVSGLVTKKRVQRITELVNSLNADIVCITGDLMDGTVEQLKHQMEPFKNLHAKKRVIYITGNHEFYNGPHHWKDFFKNEFGWKVLSNTSHIEEFENFQLNFLGIEDRHWLKYKKISKKEDLRIEKSIKHLNEHLSQPSKPAYNILLAHQPKDWQELIKYPWIDLQLSGHTHGGGQMWPLHYIVKKDQTYYAGLSIIPETNQHIYVNQGTGFWGPPMRIGTTSEITCLTFE